MARDPSILESSQPSAIAPASPTIAHVQLRDLLICPQEQGVLNYVAYQGIVEQDLNAPGSPIRVLSRLRFTPNSLTSLQVGEDTLIAAGGQETEIYLSYRTASSTRRRSTRTQWEFDTNLTGSINNSVLLTSLSLTRSNESSVDPRVGISNNDGSVRLYDVPLRVQSARRKLREVGMINLEVPVNHSSISPDGRTLLSVGDSNKVYIHQITGGSRISFQPVTTLTIPPPDSSPLPYSSLSLYSSSSSYGSSSYSSLAASFSTAFSGDGSKFAVASQEGVVAVWDVRSTKPMKVFHTEKNRASGPRNASSMAGDTPISGNGGASGWLSDDPWEWTRGTKAPGWCVRSVKFNSGAGARVGREVMAFTEHTSVVHIVDARTFETDEIIRVPALPQLPDSLRNPPRRGPLSTTIPSNSASASLSAGSAARLRRARLRHGASMAGSSAGTATGTGTGITMEARTSASGRQLNRAELFEAMLLEESNPSNAAGSGSGTTRDSTASANTSRSLLARLLPVSNARRSGLDSLTNTTTANASTSTSTTTSNTGAVAAARQNRRVSPTATGAGTGSGSGEGPTRHRRGVPRRSSLGGPSMMSPSDALVASTDNSDRLSTQRGWATGHARSTSDVSGASGSGFGLTSRGTNTINTPTSSNVSTTPAIVQALGDAFRIPLPATVPSSGGGTRAGSTAYSAPASIGDSTWRTLSGTGPVGLGSLGRVGSTGSSTGAGTTEGGVGWRRVNMPSVGGGLSTESARTPGENQTQNQYRWNDAEEPRLWGERDVFDDEGIVVVPDLGDRDVESEVHALLAVHGIESRLGGGGLGTGGSGAGAGGVRRTHSASTDATVNTNGSAGAQTAMEYEAHVNPSYIITEEDENENEDGMDEDPAAADEDLDLDLDLDEENDHPRHRLRPRVLQTRARHGLGGRRSFLSSVLDEEEGVFELLDEEGRVVEVYDADRRVLERRGREGEGVVDGGEGDVDWDAVLDARRGGGVVEDGDDAGIGEEDERMSVDEEEDGVDEEEEMEEEFECASQGSRSRSESPFAVPSNNNNGFISSTTNTGHVSRRYGSHSISPQSSFRPTSASASNTHSASASSSWAHPSRKSSHRTPTQPSYYTYYDDLDIAGMCFDPWGEKMYVAGVGIGGMVGRTTLVSEPGDMFRNFTGPAISESNGVGAVVGWNVRGTEKQWWADDGWL